MVVELPEEVKLPEAITVEPGIPYYYAAWGIKYRFSPTGEWRISPIVFESKIKAAHYMKQSYLRYPDMAGDVVPVKRTTWIDVKGNFRTSTEELTEELG